MRQPSTVIGGRYALYEEIASGGMATVHLGRLLGDAGFSRTVAIKRLHSRFAKDDDFVGMFLDEARLVSRIRHPNVVQTLDVVANDGEIFIVMDYVHGEAFIRLLREAGKAKKPSPTPIVASIVIGLLRGLHAAHEAVSDTGEPLGIVHRDVSPHNVLVGEDGVARLIDFGVAKAQERVQTTAQGHLKGKLAYMSPEQVRGESIDRRTDVYAASVMMWEALTGKRLFAAENEGATIHRIMTASIVPPSTLAAGLPSAIDRLALRGLSRDPKDRFSTAEEMAQAIESVVKVATTAEVGAWARELVGAQLEARAKIVREIESASASMPAESVRSIASMRRKDMSAVKRTVPYSSSSPQMLIAAADASPGITPAPGPGMTQHFPSSPAMSVQPTTIPPTTNPLLPAQASTVPPPNMGPPPSLPGHDTGSARSAPGSQLRGVGPAKKGSSAIIAIAAVVVVLVGIGGGVIFSIKQGYFVHAASTSSASTPSRPSVTQISSVPISSIATTASAAPMAACPSGMVEIPGGKFFMGSDDDLPFERPAHQVSLKPYCMDKTEVTVDDYRACSDKGECKRAGTVNDWPGIAAKEHTTFDPLCNARATDRGTHPINCVDWAMADRYCHAQKKKLPTEAEWEFAARGSDGRKYPWGDDMPSAAHLNACGAECTAWGKKNGNAMPSMYAADDGWPTTSPVGSFPRGASPFGVEDVAGNVWEWVADWYGPYGAADEVEPKGASTGADRVIRGGAWNGSDAAWVRPTFRFHNAPETKSYGVGFRCAADRNDG